MKVKFHFNLIVLWLFLLVGCGSPVVKVDYKKQLAQAVADNNQVIAKSLYSKVNLSTNARNLISQYFDVVDNKQVSLMRKLSISNLMVTKENPVFKEIHRAINIWAFAEEVYRVEISKAVRILQRNELLIAPSKVNFTKCKSFDSENCANKARKQLYQFIGSQELQELLQKMAEKDPCINTSKKLIGAEIANRCLQKRMGQAQINLIALPKFTANDWYQALKP